MRRRRRYMIKKSFLISITWLTYYFMNKLLNDYKSFYYIDNFSIYLNPFMKIVSYIVIIFLTILSIHWVYEINIYINEIKEYKIKNKKWKINAILKKALNCLLNIFDLEINSNLSKRNCSFCLNELNFFHFQKGNKDRSIENQIDIWNNEDIQLFCCNCYEVGIPEKLIEYLTKIGKKDIKINHFTNHNNSFKESKIILEIKRLIEEVFK